MADGTKTYSIVINGIRESIDGVQRLNDALKALRSNVDALNSAAVNIKAATSGSGGRNVSSSNASTLKEEDKLLKQIEGTQQKRADAMRDEYKILEQEKAALKEVQKLQRAVAAEERIVNHAYSNTMAGLKQELADIQSVREITPLDTDAMNLYIERANQITQKLKQIEEASGSFGRNVGNYTSAFDGFKQIDVNIDGTIQKFDSFRSATRALATTITMLENEEGDHTEQLKNLYAELDRVTKMQQRFNSTVKDAQNSSAAMDNLLDTMESFTAMASVSNGLSSFFGVDDSSIQRSLQKLMSLQNVLQGIEKIKRQMNTGEGIGKLLSKGSESVDKMVASIAGANVGLNGIEASSKKATIALKAISGAIKGIGFGVIIAGLGALMNKLQEWATKDGDLFTAEDALKFQIEQTNKAFQKRLDIIEKEESAGLISTEEARNRREQEYARFLKDTNAELSKRKDILRRDYGVKDRYWQNPTMGYTIEGDKGSEWPYYERGLSGWKDFGIRYLDLLERVQRKQDIAFGPEMQKKLYEAGTDMEKYLEATAPKKMSGGWSIFSGLLTTERDARQELVHLTRLAGGQLATELNKLSLLSKNWSENVGDVEAGFEILFSTIKRFDEESGGRFSEAIEFGIDQGYFDQSLSEAWKKLQDFREQQESRTLNIRTEVSGILDSEDPTRPLKRQRDELQNMLNQNEKSKTMLPSEVADTQKAIDILNERIANGGKKTAEAVKNNGEQIRREQQAALRDLNKLIIDNMKDGLEKQLAQMNNEKNERLREIEESGRLVGERKLQLEKYYDNREKQIRRDFQREMLDNEVDFRLKILQLQSANSNDFANGLESTLKSQQQEFREFFKDKEFFPDYYATIGGMGERVSDDVRQYINYLQLIQDKELQIAALKDRFYPSVWQVMESHVDDYINGLDNIREAYESIVALGLKNLNMDEETFANNMVYFGELKKQLNVITDKAVAFHDALQNRDEVKREAEALMRGGYGGDLAEITALNIDIVRSAAMNGMNAFIKQANQLKNAQLKALEQERAVELAQLKQEQEQANRANEDALEKGLIEQQTYEDRKLELTDMYAARTEQVLQNFAKRRERIETETDEIVIQRRKDNYDRMIDSIEEAYKRVGTAEGKAVRTRFDGQFIDIAATNKNIKQVQKSYNILIERTTVQLRQLREAYDNKLIDYEYYHQETERLGTILNEVNDKIHENKQKMQEWLRNNTQFIMGMVQTTIQGASQVLDSIATIWQNASDWELKQMEEQIDKNKELLDKQEDIIQSHVDKINDIENELADARGDRRDFLIDAMNAELRAREVAAEQQKRLEEENERLEAEKERREREAARRQKRIQLGQAVINNALAIGMAAINHWPLPAIPMIAAATAVGTAQIAAIQSQKFAEGGVIQGPRHKDGGVKVLGGRAEVEGGEYITNRRSTEKNVELLEYINSKQRKLNASDLLEFFSSKQGKQSLKSKKIFADGGQLPVVNDDLTLSSTVDRMMAYSERPIFVSVVDINEAQERLASIKDMAFS